MLQVESVGYQRGQAISAFRLGLVARTPFQANILFDLGAKAIDIIEKLIRNTTEKDSVIVPISDWGKPPVAIIETPNDTYPETNIANSVLKTIFVTTLKSSA